VSAFGGEEQRPVAAQSLPPDTRALAEALADRLNMNVGPCRLTLELHNGVLRHVLAQRKIPAKELGPGLTAAVAGSRPENEPDDQPDEHQRGTDEQL
jgi:hypothetical protein